ncbi:MAG: hypothetical protein EPN37_16510 [Chitinophagaceae bacterium]|nr:MAG: hypothetical protein EPN37_16510 [Chitinophagaceae bacterium]
MNDGIYYFIFLLGLSAWVILVSFRPGCPLQVRHHPDSQAFSGLSASIPQPFGNRIPIELIACHYLYLQKFLPYDRPSGTSLIPFTYSLLQDRQ